MITLYYILYSLLVHTCVAYVPAGNIVVTHGLINVADNATTSKTEQDVVVLDDGTIAAMFNFAIGTQNHKYVQLLDTDGNKIGTNIKVSDDGYNERSLGAKIIAEGPGGSSRFLVVYARILTSATYYTTRMRAFSSSGTPLGGDLAISSVASPTASVNYLDGACLLDASGNAAKYIIVWDYATGDSIVGRFVDTSFSPIGNDFIINAEAGIHGSTQDGPSVAAITPPNQQSQFVVVFRSLAHYASSSFRGQRYNYDGTTNGGVFNLPLSHSGIGVHAAKSLGVNACTFADGYVFVWQESNPANIAYSEVGVQAYDFNHNTIGSIVEYTATLDEENPDCAAANGQHGGFVVVIDNDNFGGTTLKLFSNQAVEVASYDMPTSANAEFPHVAPLKLSSEVVVVDRRISQSYAHIVETGDYYVGPASPTSSPTAPTAVPTASPTVSPTDRPTDVPTTAPTSHPTREPTSSPSIAPTMAPTPPTPAPTLAPAHPTRMPTFQPSRSPTSSPTQNPTKSPTMQPTPVPTPLGAVLHEGRVVKLYFEGADCDTFTFEKLRRFLGSELDVTYTRFHEREPTTCVNGEGAKVSLGIVSAVSDTPSAPVADCDAECLAPLAVSALKDPAADVRTRLYHIGAGDTFVVESITDDEVVVIPSQKKKLSDGALIGLFLGVCICVIAVTCLALIARSRME